MRTPFHEVNALLQDTMRDAKTLLFLDTHLLSPMGYEGGFVALLRLERLQFG